MSADRRPSVISRLFWGLLLLSAGMIFWLDRIGRIEANDLLHWWPVVALAAGMVELLQRRWPGALVWVTIGLFFLLPRLGLPRLPLRYIIGAWPLLISFAGAMVISHAWRQPEKRRRGPTFSSSAFMGAHVQVVRSDGLAGGEAMAVMAGIEIEFAPVRSQSHPIDLDVLAFWGGIEVRVPAGWRVINKVTPILGGYDDRTARAHDDAPTVVIRGTAIMGGIEVKNTRERA